jgi:hypothetical protein
LPAAISSIERPEAIERSSAAPRAGLAVDGGGVAVLDQQPVVALAPLPASSLRRTSTQEPPIALALHHEFQLALRERFVDILEPVGRGP